MSDKAAGACTTVAKGSVGGSGSTATLEHSFDEKIQKLMVLRNVKSNLCGNTGAAAFLFVNGVPQAHGMITEVGHSIQAEAGPGDQVVAYIHTFPIPNDIVCVDPGELYVELDECDLVT